jgi:4-amino-4-deoxy-L-arabinose transferase-like glycosyltransferase
MDAIYRNWSRALLLIFVVALLARGAFILMLQDGFYFPDSTEYSAAAVNLITKGELGAGYNRPPGYPAFLAVIYALFGKSIFATRAVESVLGAFLAFIVAIIGKRIGGEIVGAFAGILWAIYPMGVFIAGLVYPENLLTMLLALGMLCFLPPSHQDLSNRRVFLAGLLWGLATLTKPVVLGTVGAVSLWLMFWGRGKRLLLVSTLLLGAAVTVGPWAVRDFYVYDRFVIVDPRAVQHLPVMPAAEGNLNDRNIENLLKQPGAFTDHFQREFVNFWKVELHRISMDWPSYRKALHKRDSRIVQNTIFTSHGLINTVSIMTTAPLFLFAIIGTAVMLFEHERRRHVALLWTTILSFAVVYSIFYAKTRYRVPIEPYIVILSAYGMWKSWGAMKWALMKCKVRSSKRLDVQSGQLREPSTLKPQPSTLNSRPEL